MREVFTDLVSICALREIIPLNDKLYRDVVKNRSYIGGDEFNKYFGNKLQQYVLENPESHLKELINDI